MNPFRRTICTAEHALLKCCYIIIIRNVIHIIIVKERI